MGPGRSWHLLDVVVLHCGDRVGAKENRPLMGMSDRFDAERLESHPIRVSRYQCSQPVLWEEFRLATR